MTGQQPWTFFERHFVEAARHVTGARQLPALIGRPAPVRWAGRLAARMIQAAASVVTVRQTQYNHSLLEAVRELSERLRERECECESLAGRLRELEAVVEPIHTRPGSLDAAIWNVLRHENEYRLPDRFDAGDVILDIGMHLGGFSFCCLQRGAGKVYGFEPEPGNFAQAVVNLARFGNRAVPSRRAVWRNDSDAGALFWNPSDDPLNTGGGTVLDADGIPVDWVRFDEVVDAALPPSGRIRLLKIDCEAAEFPILFTSRRLDRIDEIRGEYHEIEPDRLTDAWRVAGVDRFDRHTLKDHLEREGFRVELVGDDSAAGLFFADRP